MKKIGLFAIKDIISDVFETGLIPASNSLVAMRGFKNYGQNEKDPVSIKEKALYFIANMDDDLNITDCEKVLICTGSDVDDKITDFLSNFNLED